MTERRPGKSADADPTRRRHRRVRLGPVGTVSARRARQIVIVGTTALVAAATVLGYGAQEADTTLPLPAAEIPLGSAGYESTAGAGGEPSGTPSAPRTSPAAVNRPVPTSGPPGRSASPPRTAPPGATTPPAKTVPPPPATTRPPAAPAPAAPRLVGPASLDGFDTFLDDFCEKQGFRGAHLLNGRRTPTTGRWVCTRFTRISTIDLDDACQDTFGAAARARAQVDGDIRTVRCFSS